MIQGQGYRGSSLQRRGFGAERLAEGHRGLVHVSVSCYGAAGPWRERPGWEQLAQSAAGLCVGHDGWDHPATVAAAVCDYTTGYLAALGAGAALLRRAREGGSYAVEARLCQTATWVGGLPLVDASAAPPFDPSGLPSTATVTDWGPLQHLSPVAQLSATPGRYAVPPPTLGAHPPRF